jgi:hypothetical protein
LGGQADAFAAKLSSDGASLVFSTYLGGSNTDGGGDGIVVDSVGNAYIIGAAGSSDFPVADPVQANCDTGGGFCGDAFIAKLAANGSVLLFGTFLGGSGSDLGADMAVDDEGNMLVTGLTRSTDFPVRRPLQRRPGGGLSDGFVAKIAAGPVTGPQVVDIDIKPWRSDSNNIYLKTTRRIRVAIFSSPDFDAPTDVKRVSLTFGRTGFEDSLFRRSDGSPDCRVHDVDGDGRADLVCHFNPRLAGFQPGDIEGVLRGQTRGDVPVEGRDAVQIVP